LLELENIKSVEASASTGTVLIEYGDKKPSLEKLNEIFKKDRYVFSEQTRDVINNLRLRNF